MVSVSFSNLGQPRFAQPMQAPQRQATSSELRFGLLQNGFYVTGRTLDELLDRGALPPDFVEKMKGKRFLDVGAGRGTLPIILREKYGIEAIGVDPQRNLPNRPYLINTTIQKLKFPKNSFDYIFSSMSLFSLPYTYQVSFQQRKAALKKMAYLLKPGGTIRLTRVGHTEELLQMIKKIPELEIILLEEQLGGAIELTKKPENPFEATSGR